MWSKRSAAPPDVRRRAPLLIALAALLTALLACATFRSPGEPAPTPPPTITITVSPAPVTKTPQAAPTVTLAPSATPTFLPTSSPGPLIIATETPESDS